MAPKRPKGVDVFPKVVEDASPMSPSPTDLYAALDLGTNSCRTVSYTHLTLPTILLV